MDIIIYINGINKNGEIYLKSLAHEIIKSVINCLKDKIELATYLENIYITDKENFGRAVNEVSPDARFTNNHVLHACAKILRSTNSEKYSIVFDHDIFTGFYLEKDQNKSTWSNENYNNFFCIAHEIGHLIDNLNRPQTENNTHNNFRIKKIANYNSINMLDEYYANKHCAIYADYNFFAYLNKTTNNDILEIINKLNIKREKYLSSLENPINIAHYSTYFIWAMIIQYSKLYALKHNNPNLTDIEILFWDGASKKAIELMNRLESNLCEINKKIKYELTSEHFAEFYYIWLKLALNFGFKFMENILNADDEDDEVYVSSNSYQQ